MFQFMPGLLSQAAALHVAGGAPSWVTSAASNPGGNNSGWNGFTLRQWISNTDITNTSGTQVRVTLKAGGSQSATIDTAYIGHAAAAGDAYDFEATPTQLTFNTGSAGATIAGGGSIVSDAVTFDIVPGKDLIVAVHFSGTSAVGIEATRTTWQGYYKSAVSEAGTVNVTGYTTGSNDVYFVSKVESS